MKTITVVAPIGRSNFHNMSDIIVRVPDEAVKPWCEPGQEQDATLFQVGLSPSQVRRIERHFCPSRSHGCTCGSGIHIDYTDWQGSRRGGSIMVDTEDIA